MPRQLFNRAKKNVSQNLAGYATTAIISLTAGLLIGGIDTNNQEEFFSQTADHSCIDLELPLRCPT